LTNAPSASSSVIIALAELDKSALSVLSRQVSIKDTLNKKTKALQEARARLQLAERELEGALADQGVHEERIKDEERKIIDRRKQLTALGGTKGAKMVERELDLSTRAIQGLEERALKAMELVEQRTGTVSTARAGVEQLERDFAEQTPQLESELREIEARFTQLQGKRSEVASQVEPSVFRLYERIKGKYPADAAVIASNNTCQGCHRSLPANLYQQVLLLPETAYRVGQGNNHSPVQCPGCNRILAPDGAPTTEG
jgi:predicted  nucleic acid-binding Zn-ribbon protein